MRWIGLKLSVPICRPSVYRENRNHRFMLVCSESLAVPFASIHERTPRHRLKLLPYAALQVPTPHQHSLGGASLGNHALVPFLLSCLDHRPSNQGKRNADKRNIWSVQGGIVQTPARYEQYDHSKY